MHKKGITLAEALACKRVEKFNEYVEAIYKRDRLGRSLSRLNDKRYDLEIAIEILEGDERQAIKKEELGVIEKKITKKMQLLNKIQEFIESCRV